jgi:hypothetical protein
MPRVVRAVGLAVVLLAMVLASARADAPAAVSETTAVKGRVPLDLVGRWLVAHDARLPTGKLRPFVRLVEIRQGAEHLELHLHQVELPDDLKARREQAAAAGESWHPTPDDLAIVTGRWAGLAPIPSDLDHVENELFGADAFTDELKHDEETRDSDAAIVTKEFFSGAQPVKSTIAIYGVRERSPAEFAGTFVSTSIATAPFPLPITLRGAFRAYRLGPAPARSLVARVLDLFTGCGRR